MSDKQTFLHEKPYGFVPLVENCEQKPAFSQQSFEKGTYSGKLMIELTVRSLLHIGSGYNLCNENGKIENLTMRRQGRVVIPGSSIKGAVRAIAEAVSYSCAVKLPDARLHELKAALPKVNRNSCDNLSRMCPACSMFGMVSKNDNYKGKISFGEFVCIGEASIRKEELPLLESPFKNYPREHDTFAGRYNYGNERLYYCRACENGNCDTCSKYNYFEQVGKVGKNREMQFRGRKFYHSNHSDGGATIDAESKKILLYEMLEPGSVLKGEIAFQNISREELKLLAYALNVNGQFQMRLGYGKPLGYGKVEFSLKEVEDMMVRYFGGTGVTKDMVEGLAVEYREQSSQEIKEAIRCLEEILV